MTRKSMTIGEAIKSVRKGLGLSQEKFGRIIQKSRETISAYERDAIMPGADTYLEIMGMDKK